MIFQPLPLTGAFIIDLEKLEDKRGFFSRSFCKKEFLTHGLATQWAQMNNTFSHQKGTLRGLHFQRSPMTEVKLVRCLSGAIWDVIVDLRLGSKTFGKWYGAELNEENRSMMYVPSGFAHGFQTLTDDVEQLYLHSEFYSAKCEGGLFFDDPSIGIEWPKPVTVISSRDLNQPLLEELSPITI